MKNIQVETLKKAQQTVELLIADLRELTSVAVLQDNRALIIVTRQLLADTIKTMQILNELH
jgi:hypothetical protein